MNTLRYLCWDFQAISYSALQSPSENTNIISVVHIKKRTHGPYEGPVLAQSHTAGEMRNWALRPMLLTALLLHAASDSSPGTPAYPT